MSKLIVKTVEHPSLVPTGHLFLLGESLYWRLETGFVDVEREVYKPPGSFAGDAKVRVLGKVEVVYE